MGNSIINSRRIIKIIGALFLIVIFTSCFTLKSVQIEVLKPAKIVIPSKIQTLVLLNASIPLKPEISNSKGAQIVYWVDSLSTQELLKYTNEKLIESSRFIEVKLYPKIYSRSGKERLKPISKNDIEAICYQSKTDGLLTLDVLEIKDTLIRYTIVDEFGYQSGKAFALLCRSLWRLYDADNQSMVVQKLFTDTVFFSEFNTRNGFQQSLKTKDNREWLAYTLANELGFKINETFAPYWVSVRRDMILGSSDGLQKAGALASKDKWKEAAKIWQIMTKDDNVKVASVACYNMALVCEVQGRLDLSLAWLDKSDQLYEISFSENYRNVLNYRLSEASTLNEQFGQ